MLQSYSRTNKYTAAIIGYVFGAGVLTTIASPNFGRLYKRQSENEGGRLPWEIIGKTSQRHQFLNSVILMQQKFAEH